MIKVSLKKLAERWNPYVQTVWVKLDKPITKAEVALAIKENRFISPDVPKKMAFDFWDESTREEHVERVAWLVQNFNLEHPIDIDFGIPGLAKFELVDGNHRLAASIYLDLDYINAEWSGSEPEMKQYLFEDLSFLNSMSVEQLLDVRSQARSSKDYEMSDLIRKVLDDRLVFVFDTKDGQETVALPETHFTKELRCKMPDGSTLVETRVQRIERLHGLKFQSRRAFVEFGIKRDIKLEKLFEAWLYSTNESMKSK